MDKNHKQTGVSNEEYDELLRRLKNAETENKKLSRELRISKTNFDIVKINMETQTVLTKVITGERQRQEMYVRLLLESCPDPMFIFDESMKFLLGTKSTTGIIGIDDVSILQGRELDSIVARYHPSIFTKETVNLIKRIISNRGQGDIEEILEVSSGENRYEINILPFYKDDGEFAGALILVHDITEIIRSKEIAEQASMAKGEFLSRMSHEMRTPMNAIIGMTNIARRSDDPEKKEYCLDRIESASNHLLGVINDILDMSKIEANKFELYYDVFDFEKMLLNVVSVINFRVEEKQQNLIIDFDDSIPAAIIGDELRLSQVITNLLTNAVKFTPESGTITLRTRKLPETDGKQAIQVEVEDTGIGISEEQQSKLFVSFVQADGGTARKYGGTGLGLAISKRIVDLMGGKIWIESEIGIGSKFIFTLPYEQGELKTQVKPGTTKGDALDQGGYADTNGIPDYRARNILIAEDVDINREIMASLLEETGICIDFAENGQVAVSMFEENPGRYVLIFMDIQMPEMDGFEATRRIRALDRADARKIPIVAMTANVFKEDIEHCIAVGMNDHLGKPINISDLYDKLSIYLK